MIAEWIAYYYINETDLMCYALALVMGPLGYLTAAIGAWFELEISFKDALLRRY